MLLGKHPNFMMRQRAFTFTVAASVRLLRFLSSQLVKTRSSLERGAIENRDRIFHLQQENMRLERDAVIAQRFSDGIDRSLCSFLNSI